MSISLVEEKMLQGLRAVVYNDVPAVALDGYSHICFSTRDGQRSVLTRSIDWVREQGVHCPDSLQSLSCPI